LEVCAEAMIHLCKWLYLWVQLTVFTVEKMLWKHSWWAVPSGSRKGLHFRCLVLLSCCCYYLSVICLNVNWCECQSNVEFSVVKMLRPLSESWMIFTGKSGGHWDSMRLVILNVIFDCLLEKNLWTIFIVSYHSTAFITQGKTKKMVIEIHMWIILRKEFYKNVYKKIFRKNYIIPKSDQHHFRCQIASMSTLPPHLVSV
jgi:hypothetical protein